MRRYEVLDSWRGVCAIFVVLYHFPAIYYFSNTALIRASWLFVVFFFVLSGFVVTHGYSEKINSAASLRDFMARRFWRLYPLHLVTFAAVVGWTLLFDTARAELAAKFSFIHASGLFVDFSVERIVAHLVLLQGFLGDWRNVGFNIPSWSISVEFWTYLVFAGICLTARRRFLLPVQTCVLVLSLFALYRSDGSEWYGNFLTSLAGFSAGSVCYLVLPRVIPHRSIATAFEAAVVAEAVAFLCLPARAEWLAPMIFVQVVAVFSFQGGVISDLLRLRPFRRAGLYSYSIYMDHLLLIGFFKIAIDAGQRSLQVNLEAYPTVASAVLIIFLCSLWFVSRWTYENIEVPGQTALAVPDPARAVPKHGNFL